MNKQVVTRVACNWGKSDALLADFCIITIITEWKKREAKRRDTAQAQEHSVIEKEIR
jgi:hypothetical protein